MARVYARYVARVVCFVIPTSVLLRDSIGQANTVTGTMMQPALNDHLEFGKDNTNDLDVIWENRWSIRRNDYHRGSMVVFRDPMFPNRRIVRRLIAVGGDRVFPRGRRYSSVPVPLGHCWVEQDNQNTPVNWDSNQFDVVPMAMIEAKATHVVWPPSRIRTLSQELPKYHHGLITQSSVVHTHRR